MNDIRVSISAVLLTIATALHTQDMQITGVVFEDKNGNGKQDRNESGIAGVVVSDQITTMTTDQEGNYTLTSSDGFPHLFISQPNDYIGSYYYAKE